MIRRATLLASLLLFSPAALQAQSARDIIERAIEAYADRMEGVDDYTVTQVVMGMESTMYLVRQEEDGHVVFLPDMTWITVDGQTVADSSGMASQGIDSNYFMRDDIVERMRTEGTEVVDGLRCRVVVIDDFEGLDLGDFAGGSGGLQPRSLRMCMDTDDYVPRRMDMTGVMDIDGEQREMSTSVLMLDYREVDGVLMAFRMEITTEGVGEAMGDAIDGGMSKEDRAEMQKELDKMPEAQRAMVEQLMKGGVGQAMGQAMSTIVIEVVDLQVNKGPPGG